MSTNASFLLQITISDLGDMSQPAVSRVVTNVSHIIARTVGEHVKFPNNLNPVKAKFYAIKRFPGVIGCVDGTHIYIQCPDRGEGEKYRNRKGRFSINAQVVGGPELEILDVACRWPGSVHDSRIFNNSSVKLKLETGVLNGSMK